MIHPESKPTKNWYLKQREDKKKNGNTLSVIADGGGKGFGTTDHTSPGGCQIHHLNNSKS